MYDTILVGVDGSDESKRATRYALELGARVGASVTAVHVVEQGALDLTRGAEEASDLRAERSALLEEVGAIADEVGHPVDDELLEGNPAERLAARASEGADLVVLGRQGLSGVKRRLLGGTTEQLLHRSDVPVVVVPDAAGPFAVDRLLVPTDGSENSALALPHAAALARIDGGSVDLLNVIDPAEAGGAFDAGGLDAAFLERLESRGREAVDDAAERLRRQNPDAALRTVVERAGATGGVADSIRAYVDEEAIDAVVMGSHGRSNLRRTLLGSVAASVLRRVDVPVLVAVRGEQ